MLRPCESRRVSEQGSRAHPLKRTAPPRCSLEPHVAGPAGRHAQTTAPPFDPRWFLAASRAKFVGDVSQNSTQNLALTPSLKPTMRRFVVRITLRQHVPLRARVQNPQRRLKDFPRREPASDQGVPRKCSLPENDAGYAPNPNR